MRIYLMRHSETDWNRQGRTQGQTDIHLNENGKKIALLAGQGIADIPIDLCITSPLCRAVETAQLVLKDNRHFIEQGSIMRTDQRLMEVNFGEWEGLMAAPSRGFIDKAQFLGYFRANGATYCPEGAEPIAHVIKRTADFMDDISHDAFLRDKNILVISHGCAIRCILCSFYPEDPDFFNRGRTPLNCEAYIIDQRPDGSLHLSAQNVFYYDESLAENLYDEKRTEKET